MQKEGGDIQVGEMWAYRERAYTLDCQVIKAEVLQLGPKKSGKVRIRLHGGEFQGLDQWVPKVRLRVPWDKSETWLRDEHALEQVRVASDGVLGPVTYEAARVVFAAYPHPEGILLGWPWGTNGLCIPKPEEVAADLGLDMQELLSEPLAFIDRDGEYYAPAPLAERLANLVIERFSKQVLAFVAKEEQELRDEALHGKWNWRYLANPDTGRETRGVSERTRTRIQPRTAMVWPVSGRTIRRARDAAR